jgi:uncharacterized protein YabE (DUF348 family)
MSLVRKSRLAQGGLLFVVVFLISVVSVHYFSKPVVTIAVDGKVVKVRAIRQHTLGELLNYSNLGLYPEDCVDPARDTVIREGLKARITRSTPVILEIDGQVMEARSIEQSVGEALDDLSARYDLRLKASDEVNVARDVSLKKNMEIVVQRTIPVHVKVDGEERDQEIVPCTVAAALTRWGITLGELDRVSLPLENILQPGDAIQIVRVEKRKETVQTELPYQTIAQPGDFPYGLPDRIISEGSNGLQEQTVNLVLEDGQEIEREVLSQKIVKAPVVQVVARGEQTAVSRGGATIEFKRSYLMRATAYCSGTTTATGAAVRRGIVAVDPRVIPLGTRLYVEGYGESVALDTGGVILGERIDLYMPSWEEAVNWGVRNVVVYVMD